MQPHRPAPAAPSSPTSAPAGNPDPVQLVIASRADPGLEHEAVHDGRQLLDRPRPRRRHSRPGSTSAERAAGRHTLHGSLSWSGPATRRSGSASSLAASGSVDAARRARPAEIRRRHQADHRPGASGRLDLRPPSRHPDQRRRRLGRARHRSGLSYDSGIVHGHYADNPELVAARALKAQARGGSGSGSREDRPRRPVRPGSLRKPPARERRARPSVASLLTATLRPSNNFFAEMLLEAPRRRRAGARGPPGGASGR